MKVLTSVFVLEGHLLILEGGEEALRADLAHPETAGVGDLPERHVMELHVAKESQQGRGGGKA